MFKKSGFKKIKKEFLKLNKKVEGGGWLPLLGVVLVCVIVFFVIVKICDRDEVFYEVGLSDFDVSKKEIILTLDFGEYGKTRKFRTEVSAYRQIKAWSLLQQASVYGDIDLEIDNGFIPVRINNLPSKANSEKTWKFYINSEPRELQPFTTMIKGGDQVAFRLE